ncbi:MAG: adenosylcobinamide-phosphate synthase CbiB [Anaerovoracaceae bacterium]
MRGISLAIGFILDLIVGDPYALPHPICLVGNGIKFFEKIIRKICGKTEKGELIGGAVLVILIVSLSFLIPLAIILILGKINFWLGFVAETIMCYQILATKSLRVESLKVYKALMARDVEGARYAVSMIVGRDTSALNAEGVTKATVETVAENTSDGVIAPLLFYAIGGAPLGFMYKAINTLDSMIGYKNDKYIFFGRFAAKLDDLANYIPARISAGLMICSSFVLGFNYKNAIRIFKRDRFNHASPNSAQTESVCAGALEIQLAGDAYYFGKLYKKKTIGDKIREVSPKNIKQSIRLMYGAAIICAIACVSILYVIEWL